MSFTKWMVQLDKELARTIGIGVFDLEDMDYMEMYEDGLTPYQACDEVVEMVLFN